MAENDDQLVDVLHATIVKVTAGDSVGTGFWVAPGTIITCAHVVSTAHGKGESVTILWRDESIEATVVNYFDDEDIALLECKKKSSIRHPVAIIDDEYSLDDELYSFGFSKDYPNGEPLTCVVEGTSNSPTLIKLKSGQVVPGYSGAPTLNRRTGAVCGVLRRTRDRNTDLGGRAVPASIVFSAFPSISEVQAEVRKAETTWSAVLSDNQKMQLGIKFYVSSTLDRIAEIYTLLNYDVQKQPTVENQKVDLKLERRLADIQIQRVVFIYNANEGIDQIDNYALKLIAIKKQQPEVTATVICPGAMENEFVSRANSHGVQMITLPQLESQLFDSTGYVNKVIREIESDPRYSLDLFIEPFVGTTLSSENLSAKKFLHTWIDNPDEKQLTILGDVGIGKTFLSKIVAYETALKYRENPASSRLPIRIDLRNADRQFTLEGLFLSHFAKNEMGDLSFDLFRHSIRSGRVLIILDGFDEMSAKVSPQITARNFQELAKIVEGKAKVILTCRTHYFRSRSDEEEVVYGENTNYGSESARELYWDLISRRGFQIAYLREFDFSQVEKYVERVKKSKAPAALQKIKSIYNLEELCQRPMLLEMIVKSIGKIDTKNISAATLYQVFTDAWIHRDKWRDILTPAEKCDFLEGLACLLTLRGEDSMHYSVLAEFIKGGVAAKISDPKRLLEIDSDVRTSTFLTRDDNGNYGFAHKSYREFFHARSVRAGLLAKDYTLISHRRLSPEEIGFTVDLLNAEQESLPELTLRLEKIITSTYQRFTSENSLLILIAIRKGPVWERSESDKQIVLPDCLQLQNGVLNQLDLHGIAAKNADFSGANLSESTLSHCDLIGAAAAGCDFNSSDLSFSNWQNANLAKASFTNTNLSKATLKNTDLRDCQFIEATLADVDVAGANLTGASINGAILTESMVPDATERSPILSFLATKKEVRSRFENLLYDQRFHSELREQILYLSRRYNYLDTDAIEDVFSDTLMYLVTKDHKVVFSGEDDILRFSRRVADQKLIDHYRRHRRRRDNEVELTDDQMDSTVENTAYDFEKNSQLSQAIKTLSSEDQEIVNCILAGFRITEIAEKLGCAQRTIQSRWYRIRVRLRKVLGDDFLEE